MPPLDHAENVGAAIWREAEVGDELRWDAGLLQFYVGLFESCEVRSSTVLVQCLVGCLIGHGGFTLAHLCCRHGFLVGGVFWQGLFIVLLRHCSVVVFSWQGSFSAEKQMLKAF